MRTVEEFLETADGDEFCPYCIHHRLCHGMVSGPNGPIFPPCSDADDMKELLDLDRIKEDLDNGEL